MTRAIVRYSCIRLVLRALRFVALVMAVQWSLTASAHAVQMYAGAVLWEFVVIETNPLSETLINGTTTSGEGDEQQISGLDFQPGTNILFASTGGPENSTSTGSLFTVDTGTGAMTLIGTINGTRVVSLAFAANGDLYGSDQDNLLQINPADATFTNVGSFGLVEDRIAAMDFSPIDGLLYAVKYFTGELGTVDPVSGAFSSLGLLTESGGDELIGQGVAGMTFHADGNMYVSKGAISGDLYQIDVANVEYTLLGNTHGESVPSLAAIVPEPSTLVLAVFAVVAIVAARPNRTRRKDKPASEGR